MVDFPVPLGPTTPTTSERCTAPSPVVELEVSERLSQARPRTRLVNQARHTRSLWLRNLIGLSRMRTFCSGKESIEVGVDCLAGCPGRREDSERPLLAVDDVDEVRKARRGLLRSCSMTMTRFVVCEVLYDPYNSHSLVNIEVG